MTPSQGTVHPTKFPFYTYCTRTLIIFQKLYNKKMFYRIQTPGKVGSDPVIKRTFQVKEVFFRLRWSRSGYKRSPLSERGLFPPTLWGLGLKQWGGGVCSWPDLWWVGVGDPPGSSSRRSRPGWRRSEWTHQLENKINAPILLYITPSWLGGAEEITRTQIYKSTEYKQPKQRPPTRKQNQAKLYTSQCTLL